MKKFGDFFLQIFGEFFWKFFGNILGLFWKFLGFFLVFFERFFGNSVGIDLFVKILSKGKEGRNLDPLKYDRKLIALKNGKKKRLNSEFL